MNKVILMGRLTRDPEVRYTTSGNAVANYSLAVNRPYKSADGNQEVDFINCVAIGKRGEFAEKYLRKGTQILISGSIQTSNYVNKDGNKVYKTDILVDTHEFAGGKSESHGTDQKENENHKNDGFMSVPDGVEDEGLPFN